MRRGVDWLVDRRRGPVGQLHALDLLTPDATERDHARRRLVWLEPTVPAVVLGSTQSHLMEAVAEQAQGSRRETAPTAIRRTRQPGNNGGVGPGFGDIDVVVRRSGGGAVMLEPGRVLWVDVVVPRDDALWVDDVSTGALWLGDAWVSALGEVGVAGSVYRGLVDRSDVARAACFAGRAPGEVIAPDGRKIVGISQRRTRAGARFQCVLYTEVPSSAALAAIVASTVADGAGVVMEALAGRVAHVDADPEVLFEALCRAVVAAGSAGPGSGGSG
jgi:lipoate---protein ligase